MSVDAFDGRRLLYTDNLIDLLVAERLGGVTPKEALRVLAPLGVACLKVGGDGPKIEALKSAGFQVREQSGQWLIRTKPWPKEIDEWTHWLHDAGGNAVAQDTLVGPPQRLHLATRAGEVICYEKP